MNRNGNLYNYKHFFLSKNLVISKVIEFKFFTSTDPSIQKRFLLSIVWIRPSLNTFKLKGNDFFIRGSTQGGIGGVIRDSKGDWVMGYVCCCDVINPIFIELQALIKDLELVVLKNYQPIEIEVDSVDNILNLLEVHNSIYNSAISMCRLLLRRLGNPVLQHSFREPNGVACSLFVYAGFPSLFPFSS